MLKWYYFIISLLGAFLIIGADNTQASDWPSTNFNVEGNTYVSDPTALASKVATPKSLEIAFNTQDYIIAKDRLYYTDGASAGSTIYSYSLPDLSLAWSQKYPKQISKLVYDSGKLYFGSGNYFYSINAIDGSQNWLASAGSLYSNPFYARVYQASSGKIYGYRFISNAFYLTIISQDDGRVLFSSSLQQNDTTNGIVLSDTKIFSTEGHLNGGGSVVRAWNISTFDYLGFSANCRSTGASTVFNEEQNVLYLTGTEGAIYEYNADDLTLIRSYTINYNASRLVKYGNRMYSAWGRKIRSFDAADLTMPIDNPPNILSTPSFSTDPVVVNGTLYAGLSNGQVFGRSLETGEQKIWDVHTGGNIKKIIYGSGNFIVQAMTAGNSTTSTFYVYSQATLGLGAQPVSFEISSPYNTEGMNQYLGQTHAHVNTERQLDWTKTFKTAPTAWDVEKRYADAGYDFIALTEHNSIVPDPGVSGILHIENSEEDTQGEGGNHILSLGISDAIDESKTDQERIDAVVNQGGIPILAHPNSTAYSFPAELLSELNRYNGVEIYNHSVEFWRYFGGSGLSADKWDQLLSLGKIANSFAGDDYTPYDGNHDGGAISVFSLSNFQEEIVQNIKSGNFYSRQGSEAPRIIELNITSQSFSTTVSEVSDISFVGRDGRVLEIDTNTLSAQYSFKGDEIYVRAEIESVKTGKKAWTQAISVSPRLDKTTVSPGRHDVAMPQASLSTNATDAVNVRVLPKNLQPASSPPIGYLSPIYDFNTTGQVLEGNRLAISYADKNLPVSSEHLSIFTYDEIAQSWQKCPSQIDSENKIVIAELPHYSLYTLSADIPNDTLAPNVSLVSPESLESLTGSAELKVSANDNETVTSVTFLVDGREIDSDIYSEDVWGATLDTSSMTKGNHLLTVVAEDFSGNITTTETPMTILDGIEPPTIMISAPREGGYLHETSNIEGVFSSEIEVDEINIYLDEVFIDRAEVDAASNSFEKDMDWSLFKDGDHTLKLMLLDKNGNLTSEEKAITIGDEVSAQIISPQEIDYLKNSVVDLTINLMPIDAEVVVTIDGKEVSAGTAIDLYDYSLGEHLVEVKLQGDVIAASRFSVITSYADAMSVVARLKSEGHFKNDGIPTAITSQLRAAELAHIAGPSITEEVILRNLLEFVNRHSSGKNPNIESSTGNCLANLFEFLMVSFGE